MNANMPFKNFPNSFLLAATMKFGPFIYKTLIFK